MVGVQGVRKNSAGSAARPARELMKHWLLVQRLARRAARNGGSGVDADDIAQEAYVLLLLRERRGSAVSKIESAPAYLATVVRNAARRARVKAERAGVVAPRDDISMVESESAPFASLLTAHVTAEDILLDHAGAAERLALLRPQLRPKDALALDLLLIPGLATRTVADKLGISENHLYQIRFRIVDAVRALDTALSRQAG